MNKQAKIRDNKKRLHKPHYNFCFSGTQLTKVYEKLVRIDEQFTIQFATV